MPGREQTDRRLTRGTATRQSIVRAAAELLNDGETRPTSRQVARRAGVSRRLVFHYFPRFEALVLHAIESQVARRPSLFTPVPSGWPIGIRVDVICRQRRDLYESIGPAFDAAWQLAGARPLTGRSPVDPLRLGELRMQLTHTFGPEIEHAGTEGPMLVDWLDVVTGWEHWHVLCSREGLTPPGAERSVAALLRRVLAAP